MSRIFILGGYGVFGARLSRLLDRDAGCEIIIAGRNKDKAETLARSLTGPAKKQSAAIDKSSLASALQELRPDLLVHCAGPFQAQDYTVARTCIDHGVHYADLSDGRAYTEGFGALDRAAKEAGVFVLTAASTTSALSCAAALSMATDFAQVDKVSVGVTPGNRAPRGLAVVEAILSYVGESIPWRANGVDQPIIGWGELTRKKLPMLGERWFSPCDAPDMAVMPGLFPQARNIEFRAGLELSVLHLSLWSLAQLRRRRFIHNLRGAASALHAASKLFQPFGSDKGGMFVEIMGAAEDGAALSRRWTLFAGSGDGPYIPAMAAAVLARKLAKGALPEPGARACAGDVTLEDFENEFRHFDIKTGMETLDE